MNFEIPLGVWAENLVNFILDNYQPALDGIAAVVDGFGAAIDNTLLAIPIWILLTLVTGFAFWRVSWKFALFTLVSLLLIVSMNLWTETVATLGLVLSSTVL